MLLILKHVAPNGKVNFEKRPRGRHIYDIWRRDNAPHRSLLVPNFSVKLSYFVYTLHVHLYLNHFMVNDIFVPFDGVRLLWMLHQRCLLTSTPSICYMKHLFMLNLQCHLLQDSLCVFPWTSSKISNGFIFRSYPLHRYCIPLLILSLSTKRSGSGAFCDTSCLQVQLMYSLCIYNLDVSLCLVLRWTTSSWYVVRMSEVAHVLYQFIQHSAMYFLDMHK